MASKKRGKTAAAKAPTTAARKRAKSADRSFEQIPWDGTVNTDDLLRPGGALLAMLAGRARQLGHTRRELAGHLGVTYGYIAQLASGHRRAEHISDDFAKACARYLGVPKVTILMASGAITPQDVFEKPDEIESSLHRALAYMEEDPVFGPIMPPELLGLNASPRVQFFAVRLFETARGCKLIPGEHSLEAIAASIRGIEEYRERLLKKAKQ